MIVYHTLLKGEGLRDNTLYPLNELRIRHPDLHKRHIAKYEGRLHILEQRVPILGCGWSDLVFLCPVHPNYLLRAITQHCSRFIPAVPFQEIPVGDLDPQRLVIWPFLNREYDPQEVIPFDRMQLEQLREVPAATIAYFEEQRAQGEKPLWFVHVPHILYRGSIDVSKYPVLYTQTYEPTT